MRTYEELSRVQRHIIDFLIESPGAMLNPILRGVKCSDASGVVIRGLNDLFFSGDIARTEEGRYSTEIRPSQVMLEV